MRLIETDEGKERIIKLVEEIIETIRRVDDDSAMAMTSMITLIIASLVNMGFTREQFIENMLIFWDRYQELNNAPE